MNMEALFAALTEAAPLAGWRLDAPEAAVNLTSLDVIVIVARLYEAFDIVVPYERLKRENFGSLDAVRRLCEEIKKEAVDR